MTKGTDNENPDHLLDTEIIKGLLSLHSEAMLKVFGPCFNIESCYRVWLELITSILQSA